MNKKKTPYTSTSIWAKDIVDVDKIKAIIQATTVSSPSPAGSSVCVFPWLGLSLLLVSLSPPSAMAVTDLCPTPSNPSPSWRTAQSIPSNSSVCVRSRTGTVRWHYTPGLHLDCRSYSDDWTCVRLRRVPVQPGEWAVRTRGCHRRSPRTPRASWTCGPGTAPDVRDRLSGLF